MGYVLIDKKFESSDNMIKKHFSTCCNRKIFNFWLDSTSKHHNYFPFYSFILLSFPVCEHQISLDCWLDPGIIFDYFPVAQHVVFPSLPHRNSAYSAH